MNGFSGAWKSEEAIRQEFFLLAFSTPLAFWLAKDKIELILLVGSVLFVIIVELLNTGLEYAIDRIGAEYHELSGMSKDIGSAAVLLSLFLGAFIWITVIFF